MTGLTGQLLRPVNATPNPVRKNMKHDQYSFYQGLKQSASSLWEYFQLFTPKSGENCQILKISTLNRL